MKYYKIVLDKQIIGTSTSAYCYKYNSDYHMIQRCEPEVCEYIACDEKLYHALWMAGIKTDSYTYTTADVIAIDQAQYDILTPMVEFTPVAEEEQPDILAAPPTEAVDEDLEITLAFLKEAKTNQMSQECNRIIENGFDLELSSESHHFSLTVQDQLNLITLSQMAAEGQQQIPYHADGELCKFYTPEEINAIVNAATRHKTYHTTYYNALKAYIADLDTIEAINQVFYGIELPEEYKTDVLRAIQQ